LSDYYNDSVAGGKWKNMMSDVHIGYTQWSMPGSNALPKLEDVLPLDSPAMGVALEGSEEAWPNSAKQPALPVFDNMADQIYYIDIFNRGKGTFLFKAKANKPWIRITSPNGKVEKEFRVQVSIDWKLTPEGESHGSIEIKNGKNVVSVEVNALKALIPNSNEPYFGRLAGEYSIPANKFTANIAGRDARWTSLPDLGRSDACMGISPVTASSADPETAPRLEYRVYLPKKGKTTICLGVLPTQDVFPQRGLRIALGLNNSKPQIIDARKGFVDTFQEYTASNLAKSESLKLLPEVNKNLKLVSWGKHRRNEIFDNIRWLDVDLDVDEAGIHTLKVYMVDPEIVLEKIVVNPDNDHPSYFGAPPFINNALK
jgi:Gylcosyl hydrolase family 115 C-terminal domain